MEVCRRSSWLLLLLGVSLLATTLQGVQGEVELEGPSESECRPYIEKALKELETGDSGDTGTPETGDSIEDVPNVEITTDDSDHPTGGGDDDTNEEGNETTESVETESAAADTQEETQEAAASTETAEASVEEVDTTKEETQVSQEVEAEAGEDDQKTEEEASKEQEKTEEDKTESKEESTDAEADAQSLEETKESVEEQVDTKEETEEQQASVEDQQASVEDQSEQGDEPAKVESAEAEQAESVEAEAEPAETTEAESVESEQGGSVEDGGKASAETAEQAESVEAEAEQAESIESTGEEAAASAETAEQTENLEAATSQEQEQAETQEDTKEDTTAEEQDAGSVEAEPAEQGEEKSAETDKAEEQADQAASTEEQAEKTKEVESEDGKDQTTEDTTDEESAGEASEEGKSTASAETGESAPVEELSLDIEIPTELRDRDHVERLLKLDDEASETEQIINRIAEITLRELKRLYENAIKPLEVLYKYRDLSNRHFGDSEIFSKPLILFMGPWSGGKSSIINYLLNNEYNETSLRTGAEPSPAYFNLLMHGEEPEILDGTQLAADYTFAGLQKFGQGLEERLRGVKLPSKLLEKVNIVEIPGILEVRKQVSRVFPFNDACQWFIDRADIIFLVYDPSKLDVGPETEAILDQLKGREHQTRIILNKADQVKPEELMRVQGALIWNISPLMSSPQPPVMYTTSLWSRPYEAWAPARLLQAQERAFLRDLRSAVDKRIENKIASARRFAVRVRNHAKMVDCYLTTYYNHKSVFGNRKQVADEIIEHPQDYHIYEGLSTLTNISRYDLPDPEVYKDFFKLNPLYEFQQLSSTCTYFRGCPINRLDVAIAYDLPELVGKHKRLVENALAEVNPAPEPGS